ncbi:MAG TPA: glycosyltransferase family 2 protein [Polyangiaceae bacterium]|nr:glycosyltransferase family 2 protein [Polyangiaceae bacterium]
MWTLFIVLTIPLFAGAAFMLLLSVWLLLQRLRRVEDVPLAAYPKVAVVVPHYNEDAQRLLQALTALERQDYPGILEVFAVDDGSTNGVQQGLQLGLARSFRRPVHSIVLDRNSGSKGKAIDRALELLPADAEVLVILDSDTFVEPEGVRRLVERMWRDERCAAVCGFIVPANSGDGFLARLQYAEHIGIYPAVKTAQDRIGRVAVMAGAFVAHRMSVVRKLGGFGAWIVEDIAWTWAALAAGYRTGYAPSAVAYTYCPTTLSGLLRQRRRWARGRVEALRAAFAVSKLKAILLLPWFLLWALSLSPPTLCLMPLLAVHFEQWWVFGMMAGSTALYLGMFELYQRTLPRQLRKALSEVIRSSFESTLLEVLIWRPNLQGAFDEVFGRRKVWMTR